MDVDAYRQQFFADPQPHPRFALGSTEATVSAQSTVWLPLGLNLSGPDDTSPPSSPRPTPAVDRTHAFLPNDTIDVEHFHATSWLGEQGPIDVPLRAELRIRAPGSSGGLFTAFRFAGLPALDRLDDTVLTDPGAENLGAPL